MTENFSNYIGGNVMEVCQFKVCYRTYGNNFSITLYKSRSDGHIAELNKQYIHFQIIHSDPETSTNGISVWYF